MANFLPVPQIDTSLGLFDEEPLEDGRDINSLVAMDRRAKRKSMPLRPNTSTDAAPAHKNTNAMRPAAGEDSRLLETASAEVADALGVDPAELPQPFHGIKPDRDSAISVCSPPNRQSPSSSSCVFQGANTIKDRFHTAVAAVLHVKRDKVKPDVSFPDQAGNDSRLAGELSRHCAGLGLSIDVGDVASRKTVAELADMVQFLDRNGNSSGSNNGNSNSSKSYNHASNSIPSMNHNVPQSNNLDINHDRTDRDSSINKADTVTTFLAAATPEARSPASSATPNDDAYSFESRQMPTPRQMLPHNHESPATVGITAGHVDKTSASAPASPEIPPRTDSPVEVRPKTSRRYRNRVEQVLALHSDVSKASVIKPKAGVFENQTVAFVTLASCVVEGPPGREIRLQNPAYAGQLPGIRKAVEAKVSATMMPDIWVVLERMPQDPSGRVDRRKLQTWIQNANGETQRQIMSVETGDSRALPKNETERRLQRAVGRVLGLDVAYVDMRTSFESLGGDPTAARLLVVRCESQGLFLNAQGVMRAPSLTELAAMASISDDESDAGSQPTTTEAFDLSAIQRLYFHTPMGRSHGVGESSNGRYRFNRSIILKLRTGTSIDHVRAALEAVVGHHPMLRCRFQPTGNSWTQFFETNAASAFSFRSHAIQTDDQIEAVMQEAQEDINIRQGPVFATRHVQAPSNHRLLYLVAHQLVIDNRSWRVITDDLEEMLVNGRLASSRSLPYRDWAQHQRSAPSPLGAAPHGNFTQLPGGADSSYWGIRRGANTYGNAEVGGFTLGSELVALLGAGGGGGGGGAGSGAEAHRTRCSDVFLAAALLSFAQVFRDRSSPPSVWNQELDRSVLDPERELSDTVGFFSSLYPLAVELSPGDDMFTVLCRVREARRAMADRAMAGFASNLVDGSSANSFASAHCPFELIFTSVNHAEDNLERPGALCEQLPVPRRGLSSTLSSTTIDVGPDVGRIAVLEVEATMDRGEAKFAFFFNRDMRQADRTRAWIRACEALLYETIGRLGMQSSELPLTDVLLVDMTYEGLGHLKRTVLPSLNINPSNIEAIFPVTPAQQSLLVNQSLLPGSTNTQIIYELESFDNQIDIGHICAAWQSVSDKNPALRTIFIPSVSKTGLFDQVVLRRHSPSMLFLESEYSDDALEYVERLPALPLTEGVPWHRLVVCQAPGRILLKLEISQALCDSRSLVMLFDRLEQTYFGNGQDPSSWPEPPMSYMEFMQCVRATPPSVEYWEMQLHGCSPCLFPSLGSKPGEPKEWVHTSVDLQIFRPEVERFCSRYGINVSTLLRVAWALTLRVYVGGNDVCFGFVAPGRDLAVAGLDKAVGAFARVLPCRLETPVDQMLSFLLAAADEAGQEALHHQNVTVSDVEHALGTRGSRLFNTCLTFGYEDLADEMDNSELLYLKAEKASGFDISVDVDFHDARMALSVGHRTITPDQAVNIAHAFSRAISTIMETPGHLVKDVDLFSMNDHRQILDWNSEAKLDLADGYVHEAIAAHAEEYPDILAVCAWDDDLTYLELNDYALTLAGQLMASGLGPQTPVPVILEKSRWAAVAMLAVLHAGCVLVPVDAEAKSMMQWVINAVGARVVLASEKIKRFCESPDAVVVIVNEDTMKAMSSSSRVTAAPHPCPVQANDLACILFDLVSPKTQKAITYSHGALATACSEQGPALLINASSRVMQLSSFSTDIALSEIFTTLTNGGCICIPSAEERIEEYTAAAQRMRVNWTYLTPTLSRKFNPDCLPDMAVVCFRTRQLDGDTFAPWAGKVKVLLVYGSAEACPLGLSAAEVTDPSITQCIGSPFCGNYWIVSPEDNNRLMPVGAIGELVIGSPTLAVELDFNNQPTTVQLGGRNIVLQHARELEKSNGRLLKTGHLVRYRDHGQIEFVSTGSADAGEIEDTAFRALDIEPKLRRCLGRGVEVVVETIAFRDFKDPDCQPVLAAFVELGDRLFDGDEDLSNLSKITKERLFVAKKAADMVLREVLPAHMIPSAYIPVKRLPLTSSLKVNRFELQTMIKNLSREQLLNLAEVPDPSEVQTAALKPLPLTRAEQQVRALWADVLGVDETSITANDGFLSLGGDATLAHELVIACRAHGISVSPIGLLRNLSLTELCRGIIPVDSPSLGSTRHTVAPPSPVMKRTSSDRKSASSKNDDEGSVPQIMGFGRKAFQDVAEASSSQTICVEAGLLRTPGAINYFTLHISGTLDSEKLENACLMLTMAHPILRTAFVFHNRKVFQTVLRSFRSDFHRFECPGWRLSNLASKLIKRDQAEPVDLHDPITKFFFVDSGKSSILVLRLSRAQVDEVSLPFLLGDLGRLYERGGTTLRSGFCDVVRAAHETYTNGAEQYWRSFLDGASMTRVMVQDYPQMPTPSAKAVRQKVPTGSIQNLAIPFETVLKGAWSIVLSNLSGSSDVVFGQLIEGQRLTLQGGKPVSDVIGPTGNVIPVRTRLPDVPLTPYEYLDMIQNQYAASVPYENMQALDILHRCTDWPAWQRWSTIVQHQGLVGDRDSPARFAIGNATAKLDPTESRHQINDIFVKSQMTDSSNVQIAVCFDERRIPTLFAEEALKMLCSSISVLTSAFVHEPLMLKGLNDNQAAPRIPLPSSPALAPNRHIGSPSLLQSASSEVVQAVDGIISTAWDAVLGAHALQLADIRSIPFYEIWGSVVPAAELARYYTQNIPTLILPGSDHASFTMEEMMEYPTMARQLELIIAKMQSPQPLRRNASITARAATRWNKNLRRLAVGGIPTPTGGTSISHVVGGATSPSNHKSSRSGVSIESIATGGDSQDDQYSDGQDEGLHDELGIMATSPSTPSRPNINPPGYSPSLE